MRPPRVRVAEVLFVVGALPRTGYFYFTAQMYTNFASSKTSSQLFGLYCNRPLSASAEMSICEPPRQRKSPRIMRAIYPPSRLLAGYFDQVSPFACHCNRNCAVNRAKFPSSIASPHSMSLRLGKRISNQTMHSRVSALNYMTRATHIS